MKKSKTKKKKTDPKINELMRLYGIWKDLITNINHFFICFILSCLAFVSLYWYLILFIALIYKGWLPCFLMFILVFLSWNCSLSGKTCSESAGCSAKTSPISQPSRESELMQLSFHLLNCNFISVELSPGLETCCCAWDAYFPSSDSKICG